MSTSGAELKEALAQSVRLSDDALTADLTDGRTIAVPLAWFPRLEHGTPAERANWRLIAGGEGIHWPDLDEDISVESPIRRNAGVPSPLAPAARVSRLADARLSVWRELQLAASASADVSCRAGYPACSRLSRRLCFHATDKPNTTSSSTRATKTRRSSPKPRTPPAAPLTAPRRRPRSPACRKQSAFGSTPRSSCVTSAHLCPPQTHNRTAIRQHAEIREISSREKDHRVFRCRETYRKGVCPLFPLREGRFSYARKSRGLR